MMDDDEIKSNIQFVGVCVLGMVFIVLLIDVLK